MRDDIQICDMVCKKKNNSYGWIVYDITREVFRAHFKHEACLCVCVSCCDDVNAPHRMLTDANNRDDIYQVCPSPKLSFVTSLDMNNI